MIKKYKQEAIERNLNIYFIATADKEYNIKISKDGKILYKTKNLSPDAKSHVAANEHNRKKQYRY